jgi:hypothetical protein
MKYTYSALGGSVVFEIEAQLDAEGKLDRAKEHPVELRYGAGKKYVGKLVHADADGSEPLLDVKHRWNLITWATADDVEWDPSPTDLFLDNRPADAVITVIIEHTTFRFMRK